MNRLAFAAVTAFVALAAPACVFFQDDDQCKSWEATGAPALAYELRDPTTGVCEPYGGGGDCSDPCSPCPLAGAEAAQAYPDWAPCYSQCEGLDETTCTNTAGCRAVYEGSTSTFHQCWAVAQSGPVQGGNCSGLDAYACSQHDDCVAIHAAGSNGAAIGSFTSCAAEGGGSGDPGSCVGAISCDQAEPACPAGTIAGRRNGCWTGYCIPYAQCDTLPACTTLDESDCISRTDCSPIYEGQGCTCTGQSCTCQTWTFDSCKM